MIILKKCSVLRKVEANVYDLFRVMICLVVTSTAIDAKPASGIRPVEQAERASREVTFNHMMDLLSGSEGFRQAAQEVLAQQR